MTPTVSNARTMNSMSAELVTTVRTNLRVVEDSSREHVYDRPLRAAKRRRGHVQSARENRRYAGDPVLGGCGAHASELRNACQPRGLPAIEG